MVDPDSVKKSPIYDAIATIGNGRDITRGWVDGLLLPQDSVLSTRGWDYRVYEELLRDDQVASVFQQRRLALTSKELVVEPASDRRVDKKAAEFLEAELKRVGWDRVTDKMLFGVFYGYAVAEILWQSPAERGDGMIGIKDIKVRKQRRFKFHSDGTPRLITTSGQLGEELPPQKFWWFSHGGDNDDDPYGLGVAHSLYWPVFFKRNGMKFWLIALEKYGMPTIKALVDDVDEGERKKILAAITALQRDSAIVLPKAVELELLESARSGTADYDTLCRRMDAAISKVILSQTMTTDDGSSQSQANVHKTVKDEVVQGDADLICESFNRGPATWLTNWNFPGASPPRVWRRLDDAPDLDALASRDKSLFDMGFRRTLDGVTETYGEGYIDAKAAAEMAGVQADPLGAAQGAGEVRRDPAAPALGAGAADPKAAANAATNFADAQAEADAVDVLTGQTLELTRPAFTDMRDAIASFLDGDGSWEDLAEGLPQIRIDQLGAILGDAMTVAELQGRADATADR